MKFYLFAAALLIPFGTPFLAAADFHKCAGTWQSWPCDESKPAANPLARARLQRPSTAALSVSPTPTEEPDNSDALDAFRFACRYHSFPVKFAVDSIRFTEYGSQKITGKLTGQGNVRLKTERRWTVGESVFERTAVKEGPRSRSVKLSSTSPEVKRQTITLGPIPRARQWLVHVNPKGVSTLAPDYGLIVPYVRKVYAQSRETANTSKSSFITAAEYYEADGSGFLILVMLDKPYIFAGVPRTVWEAFKQANSFGDYYHKHIKGNYTFNPCV